MPFCAPVSHARLSSLNAVLAELASAQFRPGPCGPQLRAVLQEALRDGTFPVPALLLQTVAAGD